MKKQDLKRLSRAELLELLIEQVNENDALRKEIDGYKKRLSERTIACEEAGSIAEAALRLNGVFEAAQAACDQYTENIKRLSDPDAVKNTEEICNKMIEDAKAEADAYWDSINKKVDELVNASPTLKKLINISFDKEETES